MNQEELQARIVEHVRGDNYQPVKPRVIAKQLDIPEESVRDLRRAIKKLVKKGKLAFGPGHLVVPPGRRQESGLVTGTLMSPDPAVSPQASPSMSVTLGGMRATVQSSSREALGSAPMKKPMS